MLDLLLLPLRELWAVASSPANRWFLGYLCTSLLLAYVIYRIHARHDPELRAEGFLPFTFPKAIWKHRGTRIDVAFFFLNKVLFTTALASMFFIAEGMAVAASMFFEVLGLQNGILAHWPLWAVVPLSTAFAILMFDFALWLAHYLFHRVPLLWEFHKVHHSAEVMTPFTAGRMHPLEDFFGYGMSGIFNGLAFAVLFLLFDQSLVLMLFQINIVLIVFYLFGFHLRHSHVWMPYTGIWGKIFVSPAHHQLHHSVDREHWDKNIGFIFAFWDRLFGTLVVPQKQQRIVFGVNGVEEGDYDSIWKLYAVPFIKAYGLLRGTRVSMDPLPARQSRATIQPAE